jgi:hypothetical protein
VRYAWDRLTEPSEVGERGAKPKYGEAHQSRILALLDQPPPAGYAKLPRELVDIYAQYLWRLLRAHRIDLSRRKSWCASADPEFVAKAADIVGIDMRPPDNAVVLSMGEKPSI